MLPKQFLSVLFMFSTLGAMAAELGSYECTSTDATHANCRISLKGIVSANEVLYLWNIHDIDRLEYKGQILGQTGYVFQSKYYARFLPRTYSLQNLRGEVDPVINLQTESVFGEGAGIFPDSNIKLVSAEKSWPLVARDLWYTWILIFAATIGLISGIWFATSTSPSDGWMWRRTELCVFYFSSCFSIAFHSEIFKLFVPNTFSVDQYLHAQRFTWTLLLWSLSQLLCESVFSDPSAVERIRSRSTKLDEYLTYAAGAFLILSIVVGFFEPSYALTAQLCGLFLITTMRIAQMRFSRVIRRSHLGAVFFYLSLLVFSITIVSLAAIFPHWIGGKNSPLPILALASILFCARRHYQLRELEEECKAFTIHCNKLLLEIGNSRSKVDALTLAFQEFWDGARVSLLAVKGESGMLLSSSGPMALNVKQELDIRKIGPLVRRMCREKHAIYAPLSEELGKELSSEGLRYSSLALPIIEEGQVRYALLFMAHEGERISPPDAFAMQWAAESINFEFSATARQLLSEINLSANNREIAKHNGLILESRDQWERLVEPDKNETRTFVAIKEPEIHPKIVETISRSPLLRELVEDFETEYQRVINSTKNYFEILVYRQDAGTCYVAPKTFVNSDFTSAGPEAIAVQFAVTLQKNLLQLTGSDRFKVLHLSAAVVGVCTQRITSRQLRQFLAQMENANPKKVFTSDINLRKLLEENQFSSLKSKRAA